MVTLQARVAAGLLQSILPSVPESDRFQLGNVLQSGQMNRFAEAEAGDGNTNRALSCRTGSHEEAGSGSRGRSQISSELQTSLMTSVIRSSLAGASQSALKRGSPFFCVSR